MIFHGCKLAMSHMVWVEWRRNVKFSSSRETRTILTTWFAQSKLIAMRNIDRASATSTFEKISVQILPIVPTCTYTFEGIFLDGGWYSQ